jgi:BASS family bile acid:Na+ symporter
MFAFLQQLSGFLLPFFVFLTMFNVGLTQKPSKILDNLKEWHFLVHMLVANFVIVPALMIALVHVTNFDSALQAGLLTMGACAGAPFLIKLTQTSNNDIALGADDYRHAKLYRSKHFRTCHGGEHAGDCDAAGLRPVA